MSEPVEHRARDLDDWAFHFHEFYPEGDRVEHEYRVSRLLVLAGRVWGSHVDNVLRQATGQSRARWQMLFALAFGDQPVTMTELGHRQNVQWPTLVRVLDGLEADGLINRVENPKDGRSRLVSITEAGMAVVHQVKPILDAERAKILSTLGNDELERCADYLQRVLDKIMEG